MKSKYQNAIYSKTGQAVLVVANDLLNYKVGDKIKTVDQYLEETDFSRGTLHNALKIISTSDLVSFEKRGQLGSFITKIEYKKIWELLNITNVSIIMPLPYSKHYEGLATGIYKVFHELNIPLSILFLRGSNKRLAALKNNSTDIILLSYLSAKTLIKSGHNIEIIHTFDNKSYLNKQVLLISPKNNNTNIFNKDKLKVLIDKDSLDTQFFCQRVFSDSTDIEFINCPNGQIIDKLINEDIDVAFLNKDYFKNNKVNLKVIDLKEHVSHIKNLEDSSKACLISNSNNHAVKNLIKNKINFNRVVDISHEVIKGNYTPFY